MFPIPILRYNGSIHPHIFSYKFIFTHVD
uniref:Uncharacterized protein n=1 Tax=Rhizophora mucronata TaxID=61149 RepID=A0A2P2NTV9_RHIMU